MSGPVLRRPAPDEFDRWFDATATGYFTATPPPHVVDHWRPALDVDRLRLVEADGEVVGTIAGFCTELLVLGRPVPAAALAMGSVRTDQAGQGLFRRLMRAMADDAAAAGEPVEMLFTSHGGIHQRFGFGKAIACRDVEVDRADLLTVGGDPRLVRLVGRDEALATLPDVHRRAMARRTAGLLRTDAVWNGWLDRDPATEQVGGWTELRVGVLPGTDDVADGYVVYRVRPRDEQRRPDGEVEVVELVSTRPGADAHLWQHVAGVDLARVVRARFRPVDDTLPHLLADEFTLRESAGEPMWIKLRDLPAAWTGRPWAGAGELVVRVHDEVEPDNDGTWRLTASPDDGGTCTRTDDPADLELAAWQLATVWLGGVRTTSLRDAGLVTELAGGAAARLDRMLSGPTAPWTTYQF